MKYVCLGFMEGNKFETMSESERNAVVDGCFNYDDELRKNGHFVGGEGLQPAQSAVTLRWSNGKVAVTDGPYAETKEQLGGVAIFTVRDMAQAIKVWSDHPCLKAGDTLEIRPVDEEFEARWAERQASLQAS